MTWHCEACEDKEMTTEEKLLVALRILLAWATGGDKSGNPYLYPAVKEALELIAEIDGTQNWLDARTELYDLERI